jgi:hypothetical protein
MKTFQEYLAEKEKVVEAVVAKINLFEHEIYKRIPNTQNSYRADPGNTNTKTLNHSHVFAKQKGRGKELYSINVDGSGHDGSSGTQLSDKHADHFRCLGYEIPLDNM